LPLQAGQEAGSEGILRKSVRKPIRAKRLNKRLCLLIAAAAVLFASAVAATLVTVAPASAREIAGPGDLTATTQTTAAVAETPTTAPAVTTTETTAPAGPQVDYSTEELEFVQLLNEYRQDEGLQPLLLSDTLTLACDLHTADMIVYDFLNHYTGCYRASSGRDVPLEGTRSKYFGTGTDPAERMKACGYDYNTCLGENIAAGQATAEQALEALKSSPTHDANLLCEDYKVIGIALLYDDSSDWGYYWTTDFGGYVDTTAHAVATAVASLN